MADQKISQLTTIVTVDTASDLFPIVDTSAAETKKITPSALKTALALNNVDNTSDANKPISSATQTALDAKQATLVSGTNIKTVNNTSLLGSGNISISSAVAWGGVTGTLSNQTDLQTALDGKVDENTAITGATKTKITYDAKGLVTAGADATTADIADSTNKRYVTDANLTVIQNTSGTNTGDNAVNSLYSGLATSKQDTLVSGTNIKTVNSTSLLGSGDVAVQATLVSGTNIKTINSTSLLGSGDITISASPSGVSGAIQFSNGSAFASDAANLFWDDTNNRLGVGTNSPSATGHFKGSGSTSATTSLLVQNSAGTTTLNVKDDGNVVVPTWMGVGGATAQSGAGEKFIVSGAQIINGAAASGTFLIYQVGGANKIILGMEAAIGGGVNNAMTYVYGNNSHVLYTNGVERITTTGGGNVLIGTTTDVASSLMTLASTTKGFLPPRMTTTQINAIASPANGLEVYNTTLNCPCFYNGTSWRQVTNSAM